MTLLFKLNDTEADGTMESQKFIFQHNLLIMKHITSTHHGNDFMNEKARIFKNEILENPFVNIYDTTIFAWTWPEMTKLTKKMHYGIRNKII